MIAEREGETCYQHRAGLVRAALDASRAKLPLRRQTEAARLVTSDAGCPGSSQEQPPRPYVVSSIRQSRARSLWTVALAITDTASLSAGHELVLRMLDHVEDLTIV
jgi:hypothetical protein